MNFWSKLGEGSNQNAAIHLNFLARRGWPQSLCQIQTGRPWRAQNPFSTLLKAYLNRKWLDRSIGFPVYLEKTQKGLVDLTEQICFGICHRDRMSAADPARAKVQGKAILTMVIPDGRSVGTKLGIDDGCTEQLASFQD